MDTGDWIALGAVIVALGLGLTSPLSGLIKRRTRRRILSGQIRSILAPLIYHGEEWDTYDKQYAEYLSSGHIERSGSVIFVSTGPAPPGLGPDGQGIREQLTKLYPDVWLLSVYERALLNGLLWALAGHARRKQSDTDDDSHVKQAVLFARKLNLALARRERRKRTTQKLMREHLAHDREG